MRLGEIMADKLKPINVTSLFVGTRYVVHLGCSSAKDSHIVAQHSPSLSKVQVTEPRSERTVAQSAKDPT